MSSSSSILHWLPCSPLGSGSFGHVSLALNLHDGSLFAAKSASPSSPALFALHNELNILQSLHSQFVLRCLGAHFSPSYPSSQPILRNIFLEYMDGGSLADLLRRSGGKLQDEKLIGRYTHSILQGLDYLHQNGIVHCDIKSHNILIGSSGIKIADFGAARRLGESSALDGTLMRGTPLWMAPEVMQGVDQGTPADIWSLGCTVVEMLQGRPPWAHISNLAALFLKVGSSQENPPLPESISAEARDFLLQCLQRDPKARPTAAELLKHPFLCSSQADQAKDDMHDQPSPRSALNFVQSDGESDWEDESMTGSVRIWGNSVSPAAYGWRAGDCAEQGDLERCFDAATNWITVRRREKGCGCEERQPLLMQRGGAGEVRKGCEVSLECAEFLRQRKTSVG